MKNDLAMVGAALIVVLLFPVILLVSLAMDLILILNKNI